MNPRSFIVLPWLAVAWPATAATQVAFFDAAPDDNGASDTIDIADAGGDLIQDGATADEADEVPLGTSGRQRHPVVVSLIPAGFAVAPVYSYGAELGYAPSGPWAAALSGSRGAGHLLSRRVTTGFVDLRGIRAFTDSLHLAAGVGLRTVRGGPEPGDTLEGTGSEVAVSVVGGEASIGSTWSTGRLVVTCDWLGAFFPWKTLNQTGLTGDGLTPDDRGFDRLAHRRTLELVRLAIGLRI